LALERFWQLMDRWCVNVAAMSEQLDRPGFGQYPYGLDRLRGATSAIQ
jgi:hypothetical protein